MKHKNLSARYQRGMGIVGLFLTAVVIGCAAIVVMGVVPTVIEYQAIKRAADKASKESSVEQIRSAFDRFQAIDDFSSIGGKDLTIARNGDSYRVSFAYQRKIHLAGPASLVLDYTGQTK